jgi:hypothetical protein
VQTLKGIAYVGGAPQDPLPKYQDFHKIFVSSFHFLRIAVTEEN